MSSPTSVAVSFTTDDVSGYQALFSKDHTGLQNGGHLTAFVKDGRIKVRLQSATTEKWLYSDEGSVVAGAQHHLAVSFGAQGFQVYLDGQLVASNEEFTQGLDTNQERLALGANIWAHSASNPRRGRPSRS